MHPLGRTPASLKKFRQASKKLPVTTALAYFSSSPAMTKEINNIIKLFFPLSVTNKQN
jgi:hypothetical protein